jgi:hypothetical protein
MSKKIIGLAEVQIWISMNVYKGIGKKNDGSEPKYRFGFAYIYMKEIRRKIMGLAEVQIWVSLKVYKGIRKKNDGLDPKYRFVFAWKRIIELGREIMGFSQSTDLDFL